MPLSHGARTQIRGALYVARSQWRTLAEQGINVVTAVAQVEVLTTPNGTLQLLCRNAELPALVRDLVSDTVNLREIRVSCLEPNPGLPGTLTWGARHTIWREP